MRPTTFYGLVAAAIFAAITVMFAVGEEQDGAVFVIASVLWWASGLTLIGLGLLAIKRFGRQRSTLEKPGSSRPRDSSEAG